MVGLAYSLCKHKIHPYFNIKNAKVISLLAVILLLVCHSRLYGGSDSCQRLLFTGSFVEKNEWQPYGCMMHRYTSMEAKTCLTGKKVVFVGDSRIRALFNSFMYIIEPQPKPYLHSTHEDTTFKIERSSITVDLLWNPVTNISMRQRLISLSQEPVKPDVLIIGAATWVIKQNNGSPQGLLYYINNLTSMAVTLDSLAHHGDVYWYLQDPMNWKALSHDRKMITDEQIDLYNEAAAQALNMNSSRIKLFGASRLVAKATIKQSVDGLHMPWSTVNVGAMVFMNRLCNKLIRPLGSCCQTMPPLTQLQRTALFFFLGLALLFLILHILGKRSYLRPLTPDVESSQEKRPASAAPHLGAEAVCQALCRMGLIMLYFYLCDRSDVFTRESKPQPISYTYYIIIPLVVIFILGVLFTENTKQSHVLNREQTDEWKGWMQLVILIYHMSGASALVPVYMHVRVLVAAYLFQTGYGHFLFFWFREDFGLYRVCQVLFRLNFLVVLLCVVMERPYQFYYFVPLVTFWFVIIYSSLAMWPRIVQKKANNSGMWHFGVLLKLLGLLLLICYFAHSQGLFESTFSVWPLSEFFKLNGNIQEWWFRWKLDRFAVVQGMLFAFLCLMLQKRQVLCEARGDTLFSAKVSIPLLLLSLLALMTYSVWASNCKSKAECNEMHPYISVVPILAFILIRNIPGFVRSRYSSFFAWFGRISLELFICQYHIWLAADTKGILVLIPGHPSLNILLSSFIFVCVAHEVSLITTVLAQLLLPKDTVALFKRLVAVGLLSLLLLLLLDKGNSSA